MMIFVIPLISFLSCVLTTSALRYDPDQVAFNLNQNQTATDPLDYGGKWDPHTFQSSPENWRFPFYTIFLDRFVNGDPTNDDANGTVYEHDMMSNQFRNGGDVKGLQSTLDYLQGMGIKVGRSLTVISVQADRIVCRAYTLLEVFISINLGRQTATVLLI
jgi:hypothetical protein